MKKILNIIAMLLLVAAVVCIAGCSSKNNADTTQSSIAQVSSDNSTEVSIIDNNVTDINATDINATEIDVTNET